MSLREEVATRNDHLDENHDYLDGCDNPCEGRDNHRMGTGDLLEEEDCSSEEPQTQFHLKQHQAISSAKDRV